MPTGFYPHVGHKHSEEAKKKIRLARKGKKLSEEHKRKIGLGLLGHEVSEETRRKIALNESGEKSEMWKGDKVGKGSGLHKWVRRNFPPPQVCDNCRWNRKLDLANVTGNYTRDFSNWKYLCRSCHWKLDGTIYNLGRYRKVSPLDVPTKTDP